ncbi:glycoside hydrolase family 16 protein [Desarmillaria ectypa]|nr:glycoside hydrolase family 16 protein [Desarmillaria ectypa]
MRINAACGLRFSDYMRFPQSVLPVTLAPSFVFGQSRTCLFNSGFSYEAIADPTNGRVNYVNAAAAVSQNLTYTSDDTFILRADFTTVLDAAGAERNSVRLQSNKQYGSNTVIGEIDILEGVHSQVYNQATLHTSAGCTMPASRDETEVVLTNDCNTAVNGNSGCGVQNQDPFSYGSPFNNNGGGWRYAVEQTDTFINIWLWAHNNNNVEDGRSNVNIDAWGTPFTYFPNTSCSISDKFGAHNIIISLKAGSAYSASNCPSFCTDYINNNPATFVDAYFNFAWVKVYG